MIHRSLSGLMRNTPPDAVRRGVVVLGCEISPADGDTATRHSADGIEDWIGTLGSLSALLNREIERFVQDIRQRGHQA